MLMVEIQFSFLNATASVISVEKEGNTYVKENNVIFDIVENEEFAAVAQNPNVKIRLYELDSDYCIDSVEELNNLTGKNLFEIDKSKTEYMKKRYKEIRSIQNIKGLVWNKQDLTYEQSIAIAKVLNMDSEELSNYHKEH